MTDEKDSPRPPPSRQTAEQAEADRKWREENRQAIEAYNRLIEEHGLFSDGMRMF